MDAAAAAGKVAGTMPHVRSVVSGASWGAGLIALLVAPAATATPVGVGAQVWSDEFNGSAVDATKWAINAPGVWEDAINSAKATLAPPV